MNIRQLIEMESTIHQRKIPSDLAKYMNETEDNLPDEYKYYSNSSEKFLNIFDMTLHHFIRVFLNINSGSNGEIISKIKKIVNI
tara:strand:- start:273 stop:524 length:252 start_codon:yes stop_codon:yes gene_type:complete